MKTSVLKMASSTLPLSLSPSLPSSLVCSICGRLLEQQLGGGGGCHGNLPGGDCSPVQIQAEGQSAAPLPPGPPFSLWLIPCSDEVSREDPDSQPNTEWDSIFLVLVSTGTSSVVLDILSDVSIHVQILNYGLCLGLNINSEQRQNLRICTHQRVS